MSQLKFVKENKAAILKVLRGLKVKTASVEYSGSGDNGNIVAVYFSSISDDLIAKTTVEVQVEEGVYDKETEKYSQRIVAKSLSIADAFSNLCWDLLEKDFRGWEDGDGAYGTFTLNAKTGKLRWSHHEMVPKTKNKVL